MLHLNNKVIVFLQKLFYILWKTELQILIFFDEIRVTHIFKGKP